jgi:hypothetical protein
VNNIFCVFVIEELISTYILYRLQKLQIITAEKDSVVVFEPGQSLKYSYGATMGGQAKNIGRYVKCDYLECVKPPECSEVVKIYNCNEITKTISIPEISHTVNGNKKFPIIYDPQGRVVIRNNNIDGFIVRSRQAFSLSINGDCPAKLEYKMTRPPFHETKVKIKEYHPIFILEADKRANVFTTVASYSSCSGAGVFFGKRSRTSYALKTGVSFFSSKSAERTTTPVRSSSKRAHPLPDSRAPSDSHPLSIQRYQL